MDQSLYIFLFIFSFIIFLISIFYNKDYQMQGVFAGISFILFAVLAIQALNIEIIYYDPNTMTFVSYKIANYSLEFIVPMGTSLIIMVFSLLNMFVIFTHKAWNTMLKSSPKL